MKRKTRTILRGGRLDVRARRADSPASAARAGMEHLEPRMLLAAAPIFRINAGGPQIASSPDWLADSSASPSSYGNGSATGNQVYSTSTAINMTDPSIPAGTPMSLFQTERWDPSGGPELAYSFPVSPGSYTVRLYFAEIYSGAQTVGARKFDVTIEGQTVLNDYDVYADVGANKGVVKSFAVNSDSTLNIGFLHVVQNPAIKAIEILGEGGVTPVGFGKSALANTSFTNPTSLQWGPDGKLYVAQQDGTIKVLSVQRNAANSYSVTGTQTITLIKNIPNHNDDGSLNSSINTRMVTGLLVVGTAANPVLYVTSSDPRIGGGSSAQDTNLDTNSGIISRLTWNGSSWTKLDLVRGLPRSEENHAQNGMALDAATNTLYVTSGGNTNMGAPSNNFAFLPEYALSTAILSVNLTQIGNSTYDLPTLDDETRAGVNDANDPFGGNDGKNQAKLVPGGPVQVYSPGYRNPYDVVIAASGKMYTIDNGPNAGWGDVPIGSGANATNQVHEPGVTYQDNLHLVTAGFYAGHPNPTRANPNNKFNSSNPQSPVTVGNAAEGNYLTPGVNDGALALYSASTNGLVEYTASNFGNAMKGNLLAASLDNKVYRIQLNAAGTSVTSNTTIFSNVGAFPLDVTAIGDAGPFPGTIWVCDWQTGAIIAFEPNDYGGGGGGGTGADDPNLDEDHDTYNNHDEILNGTDPLSAADVPPDWDFNPNSPTNDSNLLDPDDDNDLLPDTSDPFAIDPNNGKATFLPINYTWDNDAPKPGGLLGLGFTGLMTNGSSNYEALFDPGGFTAGGAAGVFTIDQPNAGTARGSTNTQEQAFQFGIGVMGTSAPFVVHTAVLGPFVGLTPQSGWEMGVYFGAGNQDNYAQLVVTAGGVSFLKEIGGAVTQGASAVVVWPGPEAVDLYLTVDPSAGTVQPAYQLTINGIKGNVINLGATVSIPLGWFSAATAPAVGLITTTGGAVGTFPATFDFIKVASVGGQTPFGGTPYVPGGTLQAENFDYGGEGVAYHDLEPANLGGAYRPAEGIDIQPTTDAGGGYNVGWTKAGEWLEYTVNIPTAGSYTLSLRVASAGAGGTIHVEFDGVNKTGAITIPNTGGWQTYQTISKTVTLAAGTQVLRVAFDTNSATTFTGNLNWLQLTGPVATQTPFGGTPIAIPGTIQVENFDNGGQGVAYSDAEAANQGGAYRTTERVDIQPTTDAGGGYNVGWTKAGEWLEYTINVAAGGIHSLGVRVANTAAGGKFHVEIDAVNVTGSVSVPNTGGWQTWQTVVINNVSLTAGQHVLRLALDANASSGFVGNFNWIQINSGVQAAWSAGTSMPVALGEVAGGIINGKMYIVGEGSGSTLAYDLAAKTWTTVAPRPWQGHHHAAEVYNGKLYLIGGLGNSSEGKVQIYNPATNSWSAGANMPFAAGSCATALIGGKIYAAGGILSNNTTTSQAAVYNPATNAWASIASMPQGRNHAAANTDGAKLYVFGGRDGGNVVANGFNTVQSYDPATNTWQSSANAPSTLAPLPQARGGMGKAVYYKGEFYVIGGETLNGAGATAQKVYNRVDIYNPLTNTWRLGPAMPTARHGIFPLLSGGQILVAGGGIVSGYSQSTVVEVLTA
jgi:hypothetical protein